MAKVEGGGMSWEGQILGVWDPHRDPELISQLPILLLGLHGVGSLLDSLGHWEAGNAETLVPVLSIDSVGTLFKIWIKINQHDSNVLEQRL